MKIGHIELSVKDPLKSQVFYETVLGFELVSVQGADFVWVRSGEMELLLRKGRPPGVSIYESSNHAIVLYTDDLKATEKVLSGRGLQCQAMSDSDKCLAFHDPDGHWFQLVDPNDM